MPMRYDRLVLACCCIAPAAGLLAQDVASPYQQHVPAVIHSGHHSASLEHVNFAYAQVLNVDPVYQDVQVPRSYERCEDYQRVERTGPRDAGGTVLGAIIGGAIGNQIGSGRGRTAATVAGAIAGGAVGHEVGREDRVVGERHCFVDQEYVLESQLIGYDVEYRYRGEVFMSRLDRHPGDRLRIRVAVSPAETMDASMAQPSPAAIRH